MLAEVSLLLFVLVGCFSGLAALFVERSLGFRSIPPTRRYRLAFVLGAGLSGALAGLFWFYQFRSAGPVSAAGSLVSLLLLACLGSFLGCLAATALRDGLWEDNSPPSPDLQAQVLELHRQTIGTPVAGSLAKRFFDISLAAIGLLFSAPFWLFGIFLIWISDPGPILFVKNSVGRGGRNFHQYKLRSMVRSAEQTTGPILAREEDERVLWIGRFLRKTALDELPQLLNILKGDMSFVGPRPQRTVLVYDYLQAMPEYAERHRVRPGLAGLAQVAGDYYLTPRQKLRFDRLYIQYASLLFDLRLLALAFLLVGWYRWQPTWNGRLPRRLLH